MNLEGLECLAIVNAIEKGLETEHYDNWKNHPDEDVRCALASKGYYHDSYINDESRNVRRVVISHDIRQGLKRMHNQDDLHVIEWILIHERKPDIDVLNAFLETSANPESQIWFTEDGFNALKLKQQAMTTNPSLIEKTIPQYRLFEMNNPLWALPFTTIEVETILNVYKYLERKYIQMDDCVKFMFEIQNQLKTTYAPEIRAKLRSRLDERN